MAAFHAVYYRESSGREPVRAFLDDLDDEVHAFLAQQIDRLNAGWTPCPAHHREQLGRMRPDHQVRRIANLAREVSAMARKDSPIGSSVEEHISQRRARSAKYQETQDRLRPFEEIARVVIMRRAQLGLTQLELAERMGTTKSVISRIESGQHRTSTDTLRRIAEALDGHAVIGFEFDTSRQHRPELVRL